MSKTPTDYFCDQQNGDDATGAGTIGDPWKTVQGALDNVLAQGTNGDRINIQRNLPQSISTSIAIPSLFTTSAPKPLFFQGYNSAQGDGSRAVLASSGGVPIFNDAAIDFVHLSDLRFTNTTATGWMVRLDNGCSAYNCNFDGYSVGGINLDAQTLVMNCSFTNCAGGSVEAIDVNNGLVMFNIIEAGQASSGTIKASTGAIIANVVQCSGAADGIWGTHVTHIAHNSIYSVAGTGAGITGDGAGTQFSAIYNNLIEGFSGSGGKGIEIISADCVGAYGGNKVYDCETEFDESGLIIKNYGLNKILTESPFVDAANGDFRPKRRVVGEALFRSFRQLQTQNDLTPGAIQQVMRKYTSM